MATINSHTTAEMEYGVVYQTAHRLFLSIINQWGGGLNVPHNSYPSAYATTSPLLGVRVKYRD